ncbi:MAG: hypothetical protein AMS18_00085 [Gemmatimonas sp. SG8_17]|nr:MAG: hypothetical protein AMS18_00085 [Gemmatimonas sp. SG8_17]
MAQNVFLGEAAGGRIVKLETGVQDINAIRGANVITGLAEDTFAASSNTNLPDWVPTGSKETIIGFGGWTFNKNGVAPDNPYNWKVYTNSTTGNDHSFSPFRARCNNDIADNNFRVYSSLGRDGVDIVGSTCGIRILVDGTEDADTEKDGVDIVFERTSSSTANFIVREWIDGSNVQSKYFYSSAGGATWSWGLAQLNWGLMVDFADDVISLYLGDVMTDGTYVLANQVDMYNSGVLDNQYTLTTSRTGKNRIGMVSGANPSSGKGRIAHLYVESVGTGGETEMTEEYVGPDLKWRSKPYSPAGEGAIHNFRRIIFAIRHNAGFQFLLIPYVDGIELMDEDGNSQRQILVNQIEPEQIVLEPLEVPINGRGHNLSWTLITGIIPGDFYIEGVAIGFRPERGLPLESQGS